MSERGATIGSVRTADDWIERVRAASDIVEVVSQTVSLRRSGRNWMGLCPFHEEKTPSFSVHPERQFYHCFSCKAGGDVFKFVQETEKLGFLEAAELLSRRAGIPIPERRAGERGARGPLLEALEAAAASYEQWLADPERGASVRAYLERRGVTRETARRFRLGFAPPGWEHLSGRLRPRCGEEVLVQAGLAARRETGGIYDRFRHRLIVPLVAPGGQVVGFGARALAAGEEPKYLNSPETAVYHKGSFLYGLDEARRHADVAGEIVGSPGTELEFAL